MEKKFDDERVKKKEKRKSSFLLWFFKLNFCLLTCFPLKISVLNFAISMDRIFFPPPSRWTEFKLRCFSHVRGRMQFFYLSGPFPSSSCSEVFLMTKKTLKSNVFWHPSKLIFLSTRQKKQRTIDYYFILFSVFFGCDLCGSSHLKMLSTVPFFFFLFFGKRKNAFFFFPLFLFFVCVCVCFHNPIRLPILFVQFFFSPTTNDFWGVEIHQCEFVGFRLVIISLSFFFFLTCSHIIWVEICIAVFGLPVCWKGGGNDNSEGYKHTKKKKK